MTLNLQLTPEVETLLINQAKAKGMSLEAYLELLIRKQTNSNDQGSFSKKRDEANWKNLLDQLGENPSLANTFPLSDEAISREKIYQEREQKQQ